MGKSKFQPVIDALADGDLIGAVTYPACYQDLKENQVVVKLLGEDVHFLVTIEPYNRK